MPFAFKHSQVVGWPNELVTFIYVGFPLTGVRRPVAVQLTKFGGCGGLMCEHQHGQDNAYPAYVAPIMPETEALEQNVDKEPPLMVLFAEGC